MGYYKNIRTLEQQKVDDIVRWWKDHEPILPEYLLRLIVAEDKFLWAAIEAWEDNDFSTDVNILSAKRMSRKESDRILRLERRQAFWSMTWQETRFVTVALFTSLVTIVGLSTYIAVVTL